MRLSKETEKRVLDRAEFLEEAVEVLREKQQIQKSEYVDNRSERAIVEREFHTAIEACIDIAGMIIAETNEEMPDRYAGRFDRLKALGVCSPETADRMREAAGFRNVLTHRYGSDIDHDKVYDHLQHEVDILVDFLDEVRQFLMSG